MKNSTWNLTTYSHGTAVGSRGLRWRLPLNGKGHRAAGGLGSGVSRSLEVVGVFRAHARHLTQDGAQVRPQV